MTVRSTATWPHCQLETIMLSYQYVCVTLACPCPRRTSRSCSIPDQQYSGWTGGVQVKLWDPLRTRAIPERIRGVFTTRRYTNTRLPLPMHVRRSVSRQVLHSLVVSPVVVLSSRLDYCTTTLAGLLTPQRAYTVGDKCCCTTCMLSTETRAHHIASYRLSESSLSSLNSLSVACAMRNTWAALCGIYVDLRQRSTFCVHTSTSALDVPPTRRVNSPHNRRHCRSSVKSLCLHRRDNECVMYYLLIFNGSLYYSGSSPYR